MNVINDQKTDKQEEKDFIIAKDILSKIFYKYNPQFSQMTKGNVYDLKMWFVDKNNNLQRYHVEIKSRSQDMSKYNTLPLTVKKYCNLRESCKMGEKPIYISLLNNSEYYIFDIEKLDMNSVSIKNWLINDIEYSDRPTKMKIPTMFLPLNNAIQHGTWQQ